MSNKKKGKIRRSKMEDSFDNEGVSVLPFLHPKYRTRDTGFNKDEILERADLFKDEYNREDIHDRVLVLQVMPDDYEMRELTARFELTESGSKSVNEVKSKVYGESANENLGSSTDIVHLEDKAPELFVICGATKDDQLYSSSSIGEASSYMDGPEIRKPIGVETNLSVASEFGSQSKADVGETSLRQNSSETETVSSWNESKTERSDVCCGSEENSGYEGYYSVSETNNPAHYLVEANCSETKDENSEAIRYSEVYSMAEKPIPRPRNVFQQVSHDFPENERGLKADTGTENAVESGSSKGEPAFAYSEKTELKSVEYVKELDYDDDASASACDVDVLREHHIFVHACWLAVNSSYFRSLLFESGMQECTSAEFRMKVAESDEKAFLLLLRSIYDPDVLDNLDITQLMNVLRLSVKYDARFPTIKAKRVLEALPLTLDVCETIIEAVNSGGLPDLGRVMKNVELLLLSEFEPLDETWESEKFATLSEHALRFILSSDRLIVQSENTVFIALMQWIATNAELYEDITEYSDLLNLVRFDHMKPTYIHDMVRVHEIATQLDDFDAVYLKAITNHALPPKRRETCVKPRQWCEPKNPTFMWILYPEPDMFSFDEETSSNSTESSSFWYFGYKMHLRLDLSTSQDETRLYLVVENLVEDSGSVELAYDVDVKFGEGLHKSFTCDRFVYRGNSSSTRSGNFPFDERYSVYEIREILLGSSINVAITFEITVVKILND